MEQKIILGKAKPTYHSSHVPSAIQPDTLFTFTPKIEWLLKMISTRMVSPRYCNEDLSYLRVKQFHDLAFPMRCFCDINLSKLSDHMQWYGSYGIAFEKSWGMEKGIQPIQYINEKSSLREDISEVLRALTKQTSDSVSKNESKLQDYFLNQLFYYKPYQGYFISRVDGKKRKKCFADECEWRFVPNVSVLQMPQAIVNFQISPHVQNDYSNSLDSKAEVSLGFDYSDIKHIIIQTSDDYVQLVNAIKAWGISSEEQYRILSCVLVWDYAKGDF